MPTKESGKAPIMPVDESIHWQDIAKWLGGIIAALTVFYWKAVHWWFGTRFRDIESDIKSVKTDVSDQAKKIAEHDTRHATTDANLQHLTKNSDETRKSIRLLHEKFDKYIANSN